MHFDINKWCLRCHSNELKLHGTVLAVLRIQFPRYYYPNPNGFTSSFQCKAYSGRWARLLDPRLFPIGIFKFCHCPEHVTHIRSDWRSYFTISMFLTLHDVLWSPVPVPIEPDGFKPLFSFSSGMQSIFWIYLCLVRPAFKRYPWSFINVHHVRSSPFWVIEL